MTIQIKRLTGLLALLLIGVSQVGAQSFRATPDQFINGIVSIGETKCRQRGDVERSYLAKGDAVGAYAAKSMETMICDCVPSELRSIQRSLPKATRSTPITQDKFAQEYVTPVAAKCGAEGLRATYSLEEGCAQRYEKAYTNSPGYCQCMHKAVSNLTDMEAYRVGKDSADFGDAYTRAKQAGTPLPAMPASMKQFQDHHVRCEAETSTPLLEQGVSGPALSPASQSAPSASATTSPSRP